MSKFFKHSMIVMLVILSMVSALCMTVSAADEVPAGTVASVTKDGVTTYYSDFKQLVFEANGAGDNSKRWQTYEITIYAEELEMDTSLVVGNTAVIKAAPGVTPTITADIYNNVGATPYKGVFVTASATNKIEVHGIDFVINTDNDLAALVMINSTTEAVALADGKKHELIFDNVNVNAARNIISQYKKGELGRYEITVNGGTWIANGGTGYFVNVPTSDKGAKLSFKLNLTNATANVAGLYNGPDARNCTETYADDATAKAFGYEYRVGETANGKAGEVYFLTKEEAIASAAEADKVYDITGSAPVEVSKVCEHTYTSVVTAPTCEAEGYTTHTCSKCQNSYTDTKVAALGHSYAAATCTKKSTCSGCGAETGELAAHVDADSNNKCDVCDEQLAADTDTTGEATDTTNTVDTTAKADTTDTTAAAGDDEEKTGCKGTVGAAGIALVAALGSCAIFVEKKRK